jgi:hypothetical protein
LVVLYISTTSGLFPYIGLFSYMMQQILPATYPSSTKRKMEAVSSSEMSVTNYLSTRRHISFINQAVKTTNRTSFWKLNYLLLRSPYLRCQGILSHEITRYVISSMAYIILLESKCLSAHLFSKQYMVPIIKLFEKCNFLTTFLEYLLADTSFAVNKKHFQNIIS